MLGLICERALKRAILNRKNFLFYKTLHGAYIGDLFMSIIYTCNLAGVNALEYLNVLEEHSAELFKHPERLLPWNYQEQLLCPADRPDPFSRCAAGGQDLRTLTERTL